MLVTFADSAKVENKDLQQPDFIFKAIGTEKISADRLKTDMYVRNMGFTIVIEALIAAFRNNPKLCLIGHNMMYDILYLYRQFIGKLPETYEAFIESWFKLFPRTFDTKVLSF